MEKRVLSSSRSSTLALYMRDGHYMASEIVRRDHVGMSMCLLRKRDFVEETEELSDRTRAEEAKVKDASLTCVSYSWPVHCAGTVQAIG